MNLFEHFAFMLHGAIRRRPSFSAKTNPLSRPKRLFILKSPKALSRGPSRACRTRPIYYKFPLNVQWNETLQVYNNPLQVNGQPFTGRENLRQKIAIGRGSSLFLWRKRKRDCFTWKGCRAGLLWLSSQKASGTLSTLGR